MEADIQKIASTCIDPSITIHNTCSEKTAYYVSGMVNSLCKPDMTVNIVAMNHEKRQIIADTARITTSSYNDVETKYPDFYHRVLRS